MDYLSSKIEDLEKALQSFGLIFQEKFSAILRDAAIQRFEYSHEMLWKVLKLFLGMEGVLCNSPKTCFRDARLVLNLSDTDVETLLQMCDDRNLTVHTYSEETAQAMFHRLPHYYDVMNRVLLAVKGFSTK